MAQRRGCRQTPVNRIPELDIVALSTNDPVSRAHTVAQIGAACRGIGFIVITGHGVVPVLMADAFAWGVRAMRSCGS